jgi:GNAT superfamily N-acetyltransferase
MAPTKKMREAITLSPRAEATLWLNPAEATDSELVGFVALGDARAESTGSALLGLVCASVCVRGEHERHWGLARPPVDFGGGAGRRKRRRGPVTVPLAGDVHVWHLYVVRSARRCGLSRRLVDAARSFAASRCSGVVRSSAEVLAANAPALRFWRAYLCAGVEEPADGWLTLSKDFESDVPTPPRSPTRVRFDPSLGPIA